MEFKKFNGSFEDYAYKLANTTNAGETQRFYYDYGICLIEESPLPKLKKDLNMALSTSPIAEALEPPTPDYTLHWVRHKVMKADTIEDTANIESHKHVGWLPVNPAYYPHLPCINGRIECDGLVLYMRPRVDISDLESNIKYFEEKIKHYREQLHSHGQQIDAYKLLLKTLL